MMVYHTVCPFCGAAIDLTIQGADHECPDGRRVTELWKVWDASLEELLAGTAVLQQAEDVLKQQEPADPPAVPWALSDYDRLILRHMGIDPEAA